MNEYNLDTECLAVELARAYAQATLAHSEGRAEMEIMKNDVFDYAWYRVAERAKELRA